MLEMCVRQVQLEDVCACLVNFFVILQQFDKQNFNSVTLYCNNIIILIYFVTYVSQVSQMYFFLFALTIIVE
jgi:hypothetical protein